MRHTASDWIGSGQVNQDVDNGAHLEDGSPYEDTTLPRPPPGDFSCFSDEELGRLLKSISLFEAAVQSHKKTLLKEVCPVLASVLKGPEAPLPPSECLRLFEAGRAARDSWYDSLSQLFSLVGSDADLSSFQRYRQEVMQATSSLMELLGRAQREEGNDWRRLVEQALVEGERAASKSEFEVDIVLGWVAGEVKRELCERRSVHFALNI